MCSPDNYSPASLVMEILQVFCDQTGCTAECLYTDAVIDALLHPVQSLLSGTEVCNNLPNSFKIYRILSFFCIFHREDLFSHMVTSVVFSTLAVMS